MSPDFLFNLRPGDKVYDVESYPNFFSATFIDADSDQHWYFEISARRCDLWQLIAFINRCQTTACRWVGFNTLAYDYPLVHHIYKLATCRAPVDAAVIYEKSQALINVEYGERFAHMIWDRDQLVPQVDLFKVHHFDNRAKATSLKVLQFNLRAESVEDAPVEFGTVLTLEQMDMVAGYNVNDVVETKRFLQASAPALRLREELSARYGENMTNYSDVKIGEKILTHALEEAGISCFMWVDGKRKKKQTMRQEIHLGDVIFPYVRFERREFQDVYDHLAGTVLRGREIDDAVTEVSTKGVFKDLVANVDGLEYKFGTGGIHASVDNRIISSSDRYQLVDVDVASYYPNLGIKNRLYPAHLGEEFCIAYEGVYHTRKTFPKGTTDNEAFKLGLNGAYGNSNNKFSPFFDPQYTMSITINGQLLLAMLVEQLIKTPGLRMIQANTDGVTYLCPREHLDHTRAVCDWWMATTQLELEEALYSRMFIRDVNSYIAEKEGGKLKRIGAYAYETALENPGTRELPWHKDWSFRIVAKAAEAALVRGEDLRRYIAGHVDVYDFFGRTKVPRGSSLQLGGETVPNTIRYYISEDGKPLEKVMPSAGTPGEYKRANKLTDEYFNAVMAEIGPGVWDERIHTKNKSVYEDERRIAMHAGWRVTMVNRFTEAEAYWFADGINELPINYEFYVQEAEKLCALIKE